MRALNYCRSREEHMALIDPHAEARRMAALSARDPQLIVELNVQAKHAEMGGIDSARRVAELYELGDDYVGSKPWWRMAADHGDPAAEMVVDGWPKSAPAAAPEVPDAPATADD